MTKVIPTIGVTILVTYKTCIIVSVSVYPSIHSSVQVLYTHACFLNDSKRKSRQSGSLVAGRWGTRRSHLCCHWCSPLCERWSRGHRRAWPLGRGAQRTDFWSRWRCVDLRTHEPVDSTPPWRSSPPSTGQAWSPDPEGRRTHFQWLASVHKLTISHKPNVLSWNLSHV